MLTDTPTFLSTYVMHAILKGWLSNMPHPAMIKGRRENLQIHTTSNTQATVKGETGPKSQLKPCAADRVPMLQSLIEGSLILNGKRGTERKRHWSQRNPGAVDENDSSDHAVPA